MCTEAIRMWIIYRMFLFYALGTRSWIIKQVSCYVGLFLISI